eukprot:scpid24588/ scgid30457/ Thymidine kinase, cytosolic
MSISLGLHNCLAVGGYRYFSIIPSLCRPTGQIQLILGPMFSGKTTELVRRVRRYDIAQQKCLMVKYSKDTRYDNQQLATHDRLTYNAVSTARLMDVHDSARSYDVIGVDEGQFFSRPGRVLRRFSNTAQSNSGCGCSRWYISA